MKKTAYSSCTAHNYSYQPETAQLHDKLNNIAAGTVSARAHNLGMNTAEPIIVILDSLLRYAKAHETRYGGKISQDGFCGEPWLAMAKNVRVLFSADGGTALERNITTDSKDNGTVEALFWIAMEAAGFTEADL